MHDAYELIKKLLVVGALLVVGVYLAYSQFGATVGQYLPVDAVAQDIGNLKDTTVKRVNYELDRTAGTVGDNIEKITPEVDQMNPIKKIGETLTVPPVQQTHYGQVYKKDADGSCKVSVPKLARTVNGVKELTHTITLKECQFEKHQQVQVSQIVDPATGQVQAVSVTPIPQTQVFETLKLKTVRNADDTVSIQYEDTSGKTLKVTVNLRNSEKELFSGEFFASKFDTNVNDVTNSPHIVEMIVEHADYGTVSSSVFNPEDADETTIYGVFTQPS